MQGLKLAKPQSSKLFTNTQSQVTVYSATQPSQHSVLSEVSIILLATRRQQVPAQK